MKRQPKPLADGGRYVLLDAMRGAASLGVVLYHMLHSTILEAPLRRILPGAVQNLSSYGSHGVQFFFVLSGFVIAHSLRGNSLGGRDIGLFILRRQLRLDPPYWCLLALMLGLRAWAQSAPWLGLAPPPDTDVLLRNVLYGQNIAGVEQIVAVAWTLCIEIQFYLVFITLLAVCRQMQKCLQAGRSDAQEAMEWQPRLAGVAAWPVFALGVLSLWAIHRSSHKAWLIDYGFYFVGGVLCYWSLRRLVAPRLFFLFLALFALSAVTADARGPFPHWAVPSNDGGMIVGLAACALIYGAGRMGGLERWGGGRAAQYLGRISYSLYLTHLPILFIVAGLGRSISGEDSTAALGWMLLGGACSLLAAHGFFVLVEKPSMRWAGRLKMPRRA